MSGEVVEQTDMPQISRWAESRSYRQAAGATDSWREWCWGKGQFHYISPTAGAPVSRGTFPPRDAAPWLGSLTPASALLALNLHLFPRPAGLHADTHIRDARTHDLKSYTSIWIHRPGQDRGGCSPFQSTPFTKISSWLDDNKHTRREEILAQGTNELSLYISQARVDWHGSFNFCLLLLQRKSANFMLNLSFD